MSLYLGIRIGNFGFQGFFTFILILINIVILANLTFKNKNDSFFKRNKRSPTIKLSNARLGLFSFITLFLILFFLELFLQFAIKLNPKIVQDRGIVLPKNLLQNTAEKDFETFFSTTFNPEMGWESRKQLDNGLTRKTVPEYPHSFVSSYGNSFTECTGPDEETWQSHLGKNLQTGVLNFGVGGYGTDQALLKFRKMYPLFPTKIVILGYMTENINRIVNVSRTALSIQRQKGIRFDKEPIFQGTKPRFILKNSQPSSNP